MDQKNLRLKTIGGAAVRITTVQSSVRASKEDTALFLQELFLRPELIDTDFVVLPEMFCCPYENDQFPFYAEPEGGKLWQLCASLAKKNQVYLLAGTMPEIEEGHIYNTAYVFDRCGRQISKYRKIHLFDIDIKNGQYFKESDTLSAGESLGIFDTEWGTMGMCICYDIRFPELFRLMVDAGAQVVFCPASFNMTTGPMHWELLFRQRAVDNQIFTIGASTARDAQASYQSWGHSIIADPWGRVLLQMDEKEGIAVTEISLADVAAVREQLPLLAHRKTELYSKLRGKDSQ